jgi:hypothetical protein
MRSHHLRVQERAGQTPAYVQQQSMNRDYFSRRAKDEFGQEKQSKRKVILPKISE